MMTNALISYILEVVIDEVGGDEVTHTVVYQTDWTE
jgi:hypothetical protein